MKLRVRFYKIILEKNFLTKKWEEKITPIAVKDLSYLAIGVDEERVNYTLDPDNELVALCDIEFSCVESSKTLILASVFNDRKKNDFNEDFNVDFAHAITDFGPDFNNDFGGFDNFRYSNFIKYINEFEIYGYDLGNNGEIEHNPEFAIYFASNNHSDFSLDFNDDFKAFPDISAKAIAYRKPFTNQVNFYDAVSFPINEQHEVTYSWLETEREVGILNTTSKVITSSRNGVVCNSTSFLLSFFRTINLKIEKRKEGCSTCNPVITLQPSIISQEDLWIPVKPKYLPELLETVIEKNAECVTPLSINRALTFINNRIDKVYVNDLLVPYFKESKLGRALYDYRGIMLDSETVMVDSNYTSQVKAFAFNVPTKGDYLIKIDFYSYSNCHTGLTNKVIQHCIDTTQVESKDYLEVIKKDCGNVLIKNHSFDTVQVEIFALMLRNNGITKKELQVQQLFSSFELERLSYKKLNAVELAIPDGVYLIKISRQTDKGLEVKEFPLVIYCTIEHCINGLIDEFLCFSPCEPNKELTEQYGRLNTVFLSSFLFLTKLKGLYFDDMYFKLLNTEEKDKLYSIEKLRQQIALYCTECKPEGTPCKSCK